MIRKRIKCDIKKAKKLFADNDCELLEEVYIYCKTKMRYRCSCKRLAEITLDQFNRGGRCRGCMGERAAIRQRRTIKEVRKIFRKGGCYLLEYVYRSNNVKMWYICKCKRVAKITLANFQNGERCIGCSHERGAVKQRRTIKEVRKIFREGGCRLISKEYKNNRTKMKYECSCEREAEISLYHFMEGKRCNGCASERLAEKYKFSHKEVKKIFKDGGCELISKTYKNNGEKLEYLCDCGREAEITLGDFRTGRRCMKCAIE